MNKEKELEKRIKSLEKENKALRVRIRDLEYKWIEH